MVMVNHLYRRRRLALLNLFGEFFLLAEEFREAAVHGALEPVHTGLEVADTHDGRSHRRFQFVQASVDAGEAVFDDTGQFDQGLLDLVELRLSRRLAGGGGRRRGRRLGRGGVDADGQDERGQNDATHARNPG